ncbi:hypothetical protein [Saccharicrinis sp. GN24d3]|uniref:hypothetical protein n=1 Tax=Saccharicrinis sp. GN24d3 TaxID=3458416 RepID=UPI00403586DA
MLKCRLIGWVVLTLVISAEAQNTEQVPKNMPEHNGQFSAWTLYNPDNPVPLLAGSRYIPQLNYAISLNKNNKIDFEVSANIFGNIGYRSIDSISTHGGIRTYRAWGRYSSKQLEVRIGLQKINFGSATMLRPLRWFDQVDPRDPLLLTNGVWGVLGRYYFLNNTNIWLWCLYSNHSVKGIEFLTTKKGYPEFGGRVQYPVSSGEAGLSFHHRMADSRNLNNTIPEYDVIPENRIGLDARWDKVIGVWIEGVWVNKGENLGKYSNREIFTAGTDYTFGIGSGLSIIAEHMVIANDEKAFSFRDATNFSALTLSYPIGMFDKLTFITYFDWHNKSAYRFVNWQKEFNKTSLYIMGYWNPIDSMLPVTSSEENILGGAGIQLLFAFNH